YDNVSGETNLHNINIEWLPDQLSVNTLGSIFIMAVFFGLPIAWAFRKKLDLSNRWGDVVADGPVIFTMAFAFAWKEFKSVYRWFIDEDNAPPESFYMGFLEQLNEQKEMLIAVGLLIYGIRLTLRQRKPSVQASTETTVETTDPS
ncbi:MAG: hypothetical protein R3336_08825, partial [Phycisphaeraceae bacterium]|nr:hypothetical protein [Phycisphaeraceae bacterium]